MADYPAITQLSQLDETIPANSEAVNKLDDAERQTRGFLKSFLAVSFDTTGALKSTSVSSGNITDGSVTTAKIATDAVTADKIATGAVGTVELADDSVTDAKLKDDATTDANRAVTTNHIRDDAITAAKIAAGAVGLSELADDSVTDAKLRDDATTDANRAVTTNHVRDSAITNAKIANSTILAAKLNFNGGSDAAPKLMAGATAGGVDLTIGGILSATVVGSVLTFAVGGFAATGATLQYARLEEVKSNGVDMGGILSGDNTRGPWTERRDASDFVGVSGNTITIKKAGSYLIKASIPGYNCGRHQCYLRQTSGTPTDIVVGGNAHAGGFSRSIIMDLLEVAADNTTYEIRHFAETAVLNNGKGLATSGTPAHTREEIYSIVEFFKLATTVEP